MLQEVFNSFEISFNLHSFEVQVPKSITNPIVCIQTKNKNFNFKTSETSFYANIFFKLNKRLKLAALHPLTALQM